MRPHVLNALLLLAFAAPASLAAQHGTTPLIPKGRDSADVRILDHTADALDRAPKLGFEQGSIAVIGKNDTTIDLSKVYSEVLVMHDGSIVFFADGAVQVVSPDGVHRQQIGRAGAGPKEFRMGDVARGRGDTILVTDLGNSRIAWVTPAKGVVRTRALMLGRLGYSFGPVAQFGHDTLIMGNAAYVPQFTKPGKRVQFPVGLLTGVNDSIRIILPLEGGEMAAASPAQLARNSAFTTVAVRYPPNPIIVDWGKGFLAIRPDHWKLDLFQANGKLVESVRVPLRRVAITSQLRDHDIDATIAMMQRRSTKPMDVAAERARYHDYPYPDSLPSFRDVKTTAGGTAWVRDQMLAGDTTWAYTAVAIDGRILGRLTGSGHVPVAFGDDRIVLRDEDSDGLITWRVMRVNWSGRGTPIKG